MALPDIVGVVNENIGLHRSVRPSRRIDNGLGWFSLALGFAEILATRPLARATGLDPAYHSLLRIFGAREILSGTGLLAAAEKRRWIQARVAGDAIDVAFLGWAYFRERNPERKRRIGLAAAAVAPVVALDVIEMIRSRNRTRHAA